MTFDVLSLLFQEGFITEEGESIIYAEKAFFAARIMKWIRDKVKTDPDFNLTAHLTMLMYYKTDRADLRFTENDEQLLYKMTNPDDEVHDIVETLIQNHNKLITEAIPDTDATTESPEDVDRDPDP
jgi:predicted RNA polymerase sigma factor